MNHGRRTACYACSNYSMPATVRLHEAALGRRGPSLPAKTLQQPHLLPAAAPAALERPVGPCRCQLPWAGLPPQAPRAPPTCAGRFSAAGHGGGSQAHHGWPRKEFGAVVFHPAEWPLPVLCWRHRAPALAIRVPGLATAHSAGGGAAGSCWQGRWVKRRGGLAGWCRRWSRVRLLRPWGEAVTVAGDVGRRRGGFHCAWGRCEGRCCTGHAEVSNWLTVS